MERLVVATLAERPDLRGKVFEAEIQAAIPEFMRHDPTAALYYHAGHLDHYLDYAMVAIDPVEPNRPIARAFSVPFAFRDGTPGRNELPDGGWDTVIRWAHEDRQAARRPTVVSALEIMVAPTHHRRGVSQRMLEELCTNTWMRGFGDLYGPLRPTDKHKEPHTPFAEYVGRTRDDGLPFDSWVRTHVRAGARVIKIAPCSCVIAGTIDEWRQWTGLAFDRSGDIVVPGALCPVHVSLEQDHAVYIEPNLWVHHRIC